MSIDASTIPFSPILLVSALAYVGFMWAIGGETIAGREIARSDWSATCETAVRTSLEATRKPRAVIPTVPNAGDLLCGFYPELQSLCQMIPDPNAPLREAERRKQAAEDARIRAASSGIADSCTCAEAVYIEEERMSLALYAGTGRLYTPQSVSNRTAALTRALNAPSCALTGRADG